MWDNAESFKWTRHPKYAGAGWIPSWWCALFSPCAVRRAPCAVRRAPCADCYHQSLFENQPCATELFTAIQRPNLRDDFRGAGECFPSEAADLPSLSLE